METPAPQCFIRQGVPRKTRKEAAIKGMAPGGRKASQPPSFSKARDAGSFVFWGIEAALAYPTHQDLIGSKETIYQLVSLLQLPVGPIMRVATSLGEGYSTRSAR
jgi:hypothetical protein